MGLVELTESFSWEGRRIAWARAGSGPPVVFCHGTPFSSRVWAPYAEALADRFTVHLWDLPGYGRSSPQWSSSALNACAWTSAATRCSGSIDERP